MIKIIRRPLSEKPQLPTGTAQNDVPVLDSNVESLNDHSSLEDLLGLNRDVPITEQVLDDIFVPPSLPDSVYEEIINTGMLFFIKEYGQEMGKVVYESLNVIEEMGLYSQAKYVTAMIKDAMLSVIGERA